MNSTVAAPVEPPQAPRPLRSHRLMHLWMLLATFCWAGNMVAGKQALRGFSILAVAQLRVLGAALFFWTLFLARRRRPALRLTPRQWAFMAVVAASGVILNQLFFIGGLARTSVAHTGLMVALGPVMVLVLSCLMRLEALTVPKVAGMLVSFGGVAVLTTGKVGQGNGGHWVGDLLLLAGSAAFALYTILVKEVADRYDALTLTTLTHGLGVLLLAPFGARAALNARWAPLPAQAWWGLAYMIVFGSVVPYLIYNFALTELIASRVAAFSYIQPVIATGLGIWLLAEKLTLSVLVGGALILLGVYLTEREFPDSLQFLRPQR